MKRILSALTAAVVCVIALSAEAQDALRVAKAQPQAFSFVPFNVGQEQGIFAKHGLTKFEEVTVGGSAKLQQALVANSIDIGLGSGPELAFIAKGSTARGIAAMAGPPLNLSLVVQRDSRIRRIADLEGKSVAISTAGGLTDWLARELSRQQGWGPDGIKTVGLGATTAMVAAMKTGQTDGIVTDTGTAINLESQKVGRTLLDFGDIIRDFHVHVIYASANAMDKRPDQVRRFLAGWFETIAFMRANKAKVIPIASRIMNTPDDESARIYDKVMPMFSSDGKFEPKALAVLAKSFVELGTLDSAPDMSKTYTEKFLPAQSQTH